MKRSTTDTCCLTLPLKLEKWQEGRLAKRFEIARQIYNSLVRTGLKKLHQVEQSPEYRSNQAEIHTLDWNKPTDQPKLRALYNEREKILKSGWFGKHCFEPEAEKLYKHFFRKYRFKCCCAWPCTSGLDRF